jgi:uncharacterized membrane protein HdeD (DUF308 family)
MFESGTARLFEDADREIAMDSVANNSPRSLGSAIHALHGKWGWIVALGVLFVVAGFVALGSVVLATVVTVTYVGFMMVLAGVVEIVSAFQMKTWGKFFLWVALGILYAFAGVFTFENPLLAAGVLTLILGAALVATGIVRIVLAFQMQGDAPWGWVAASGVITALLGIMILVQWPAASLYILGTFLGIDLLFAGFGWINIGLALKRHARLQGSP